jgi:hypothetical protein
MPLLVVLPLLADFFYGYYHLQTYYPIGNCPQVSGIYVRMCGYSLLLEGMPAGRMADRAKLLSCRYKDIAHAARRKKAEREPTGNALLCPLPTQLLAGIRLFRGRPAIFLPRNAPFPPRNALLLPVNLIFLGRNAVFPPGNEPIPVRNEAFPGGNEPFLGGNETFPGGNAPFLTGKMAYRPISFAFTSWFYAF